MLVIMTFPGCGKSYVAEHQTDYGITCLDLDSSKFRKFKGWERHYVDVIKQIIEEDDFDYLFINEYDEVMRLLKHENITFTAVVPYSEDRNENARIKEMMFGRFVLRGNNHVRNPERWMQKMMKNYDLWSDPKYVGQFTDDVKYIDFEHPFIWDVLHESANT